MTKIQQDVVEIAKKHRDLYQASQSLYEVFSSEVKRIIADSLPEFIKVHKIESRAKTLDSFYQKCLKTSTNDPNKPKYTKPIEQITDLAGVRVIVFVPDTIIKVCEHIERFFNVLEKRDIGEDRFESGNFGYKSIHYLIELSKERLILPDYKKYRGMVCEIQVRTILQHAWAEMEHDIQYKSKSELPRNIARRFIALAGMIEIADREFQAIQDEEQKLHSKLRSSLEDELTQSLIGQISASTEGQAAPFDSKSILPDLASARLLLTNGNYKAAIDAYTSRIRSHPDAHTLYLGRAKAYFLNGDRDKALEDIEIANRIHPRDKAIASLKLQIEEGIVTTPPVDAENANQFLEKAKDALAKGAGEEAFEYFSLAQDLGYTKAFSIFNKAMTCALVRDTSGARNFLSTLDKRSGTPMEINITALEAILDSIEGVAESNSVESLKGLIYAKPEFDYNLSPLKNLERGLIAVEGKIDDGLMEIFSILNK